MIKVAQIGVGYWGPNLLRNLMVSKDCSVEAVVELSPSRKDFVKGLYPNLKLITDFNDILIDSNIDAVVIATPADTHFNLAMQALKANKHVLVEKPMSTKVDQISALGNIARKKNLVIMSGHTFLFNPAVIHIKNIIESGEIGDIRYIYSQRLNLGRIRDDVNALWNLAPHDISIIQYWLGDPEIKTVHCVGMDYVQNGIHDVNFLNLIYQNNVIANIHVSWLDPRKVRKMTIVGSKKMIVYDDIDENKVVIYDKGIDQVAELGENMDFDVAPGFSYINRTGSIEIPYIKWVEPLKAEIDHFFDCIINDIDCIAGEVHTKNVIAILERAKH